MSHRGADVYESSLHIAGRHKTLVHTQLIYTHMYMHICECLMCVRLGIYCIFEFAQPSLEAGATHFTDGVTQLGGGKGNSTNPGRLVSPESPPSTQA